MPRHPAVLLAVLPLVGLLSMSMSGCAATSTVGADRTASRPAPPRPARISHIVFFKLLDPADADRLIADCDRLLRGIPGVACYAAGRHLEAGRETVIRDYDVGLLIGFTTDSQYGGYVDHPDHQELVALWGPRLEWFRVYDVVDETP